MPPHTPVPSACLPSSLVESFPVGWGSRQDGSPVRISRLVSRKWCLLWVILGSFFCFSPVRVCARGRVAALTFIVWIHPLTQTPLSFSQWGGWLAGGWSFSLLSLAGLGPLSKRQRLPCGPSHHSVPCSHLAMGITATTWRGLPGRNTVWKARRGTRLRTVLTPVTAIISAITRRGGEDVTRFSSNVFVSSLRKGSRVAYGGECSGRRPSPTRFTNQPGRIDADLHPNPGFYVKAVEDNSLDYGPGRTGLMNPGLMNPEKDKARQQHFCAGL